MDTARAAAMSDPDCIAQFCRKWRETSAVLADVQLDNGLWTTERREPDASGQWRRTGMRSLDDPT